MTTNKCSCIFLFEIVFESFVKKASGVVESATADTATKKPTRCP
jgi:hypothetical protein